MHQELNKARLSMRPVSKNIPFVKSERALGDIARQNVGLQMMFEMEEEKDDAPPEYSDSETESDIWPGAGITQKKKRMKSAKM